MSRLEELSQRGATAAANRGICSQRVQNAEFRDVEGRRCIDLAAGMAAANAGQRHPRGIAAVAAANAVPDVMKAEGLGARGMIARELVTRTARAA